MKKTYILLALVVAFVALGFYYSERAPATPLVDTPIVELKDGDTYDMTARVVEKTIKGVPHRMLAYNGSIPGPLLKIPQGAEITINFKNEIGMNTLLHSHGVRMDNQFDGSQMTQQEMKSGETFSYKLKFPDVGVYWYHPHVREDYQQELGLYGNYIVVPADSQYWPKVDREVSIALDDVLIENNNIVLSEKKADHMLMGRFGNVMLVNGETDYALSAKKGEVVRLYLTNTANTRIFNFAISGARMKLIGGDSGAYERESWVEGVILAPSERAVVDVLFEKSGTFALEHKTPERVYKIGQVVVSGEAPLASVARNFASLVWHQSTIASIDPFRSYFSREPDKRIALTINMMGMTGGGMHMMPDGTMMGNSGAMFGGVPEGGIEWEDHMGPMNATSNSETVKWHIVDQDTRRQDMDIDWVFKKDTPVKIRITNDPKSMHPMQHPIHFHGQRFLVVARDGVQQENLVWKDTVLVKAGEVVDIVLDPSNPGKWMAHCHIAEHLESGMMFGFEVK